MDAKWLGIPWYIYVLAAGVGLYLYAHAQQHAASGVQPTPASQVGWDRITGYIKVRPPNRIDGSIPWMGHGSQGGEL